MGFLRHARKAETQRRVADSASGPRPAGYVPGEGVVGEIAVYFADDPRKLYQLKQWLPVFERLDAHHPLVIITRHQRTYTELGALTGLRRVLAPTFADVAELYETSDFKVAVYVNNSLHNFQSLRHARTLHVHVNHGESDKICMVSNQVKAYDQVFVAGEAAIRRHHRALIGFDSAKLVPVGRPQLDLAPEPVLPPSTRRTILYAPTWEGENASNNYTSIDVFGPEIMAAALAVPDVRVVYKPHPRAAISRVPSMAAAHQKITGLLENAAKRDPDAGHRYLPSADILAVFPGCDLMITDVSSVGLDFLYLRREAPIVIADRYGDEDQLAANAPISRCADIVDPATVSGLTATLTSRLTVDPYRAEREAMRRFYFGDLAPGESTERFIAAIDAAVTTRDRQLARLEAGVTVLHNDKPGRSA